jgi:hypothetical protein
MKRDSRSVAGNILETPDLRTELVKSFGIQAFANRLWPRSASLQ